MKTVFLAFVICNPFVVAGRAIKRVATKSFYATTNFVVNHFQPNHDYKKDDPGKVVKP
jgi:hypothetical protein